MTSKPADNAAFGAIEVRARTLAAMRRTLLETIAPALVDDGARTASHVVVRLIDHLLAGEPGDPALSLPPASLQEAWQQVSGMDAAALVEPPVLERLLPLITAGADSAARQAFLAQFAEWQNRILVARDPEAAGGVGEMYRGGKKAAAEQARERAPALLSPQRLTDYLRARFPERPGVVVESLQALAGGFSKQTLLVSIVDGGTAERFVIRKDFPVAPTDRTVRDEFPLLSAIWSAGGVAIAKPLWLEADSTRFGSALMAVALAEGSGNHAALAADPQQARRFADDLAHSMARLHAIPVAGVFPSAAPGTPTRDHVGAEIERWYRDFRQWRVEPRPLLEAVFAWLKANIPEPCVPVAIVHGDIGFHNMLLRDGQLSALLDWEFAHIGDPAEDLVYSRFFIEQVVNWEFFLERYEAHGGTRPSPAAERFYSVWPGARNAAGCAGAQRAFLANDDADARLGVSGMTFLPRFELDAFMRIVE